MSEAAMLKLGLPPHVSLAIETAPAPELLKELQPPLGRAMVIVPELGKVVEPMVNVNWKLLPVLPSITVVGETVSVPLPSPVVAVLYGPTNGPPLPTGVAPAGRSEEHTSELQSQSNLVCRLLLEKKKKKE